MSNLRLLQMCSSRAWGGMEMHVVHLSSALRQRGHDVTIACYPHSPLHVATQKRDLPCKTMALDAYVRPFQVLRLIRYLRKNAFDILHCHYSKDLWSLVPAAEGAGVGRVLLSKGIGPGSRKQDVLHTWLYKRVKRVIAKSEYLRRRVIEAYPIVSENVVTIPNGVDVTCFDPTRYNGGEIRKGFSINSGAFLVGVIGRISPAKGHEEFLQAAFRIRRALPETRFLIVGSSSDGERWYAQEVRKRAHDLDLDDVVLFANFREDIPAVLSALDLFVFPSHCEAFGSSLIEAMAMEKACVATAAGGVFDIVENGISGLLVPPRNVETLTEAVVLLLNDEKKRRRLGEAARKRVEEKFHLDVITARLEEVYLEVIHSVNGAVRKK